MGLRRPDGEKYCPARRTSRSWVQTRPARSFIHARLTLPFPKCPSGLSQSKDTALGLAVVFVNVLADGLLQLGDAMKARPRRMRFTVTSRKKRWLHHVQPGRTGRDPVHVNALVVAGQPLLHLGGLVG